MNTTEKLLHEWVSLKEIEDRAKKARDKVSESLQASYKIPEDKKSKTFKDLGFNIEIKKNDKVEIDQEDAGKLVKEFGDAAPFKIKYELDTALYKSLKKINESFYKRCSEAVTFKPGSVSVSVKVEDND